MLAGRERYVDEYGKRDFLIDPTDNRLTIMAKIIRIFLGFFTLVFVSTFVSITAKLRKQQYLSVIAKVINKNEPLLGLVFLKVDDFDLL